MQLVVFKVGGELYGIDILKIVEIVNLEQVVSDPHLPHFVTGLTTVRDYTIPLVDLRQRFGIMQKWSFKKRVIIVAFNHSFLGLIVDDIEQVLEKYHVLEQKLPHKLKENRISDCIGFFCKTEEKVIIVLEPAQIITRAERELLQEYFDKVSSLQ